MLEVEKRRNDQQIRNKDIYRVKQQLTRAPRQKPVLDRGHDWELRVDLYRMLVFPNILETNQRLDAVLVP